jgi:hypothetical protein
MMECWNDGGDQPSDVHGPKVSRFLPVRKDLPFAGYGQTLRIVDLSFTFRCVIIIQLQPFCVKQNRRNLAAFCAHTLA